MRQKENLPIWKSRLGRFTETLSPREKRIILIISIFQALISFLEIVAVGLLGVLAAIGVSGISSIPNEGKISDILLFLHLDSLSFQLQALLIGIASISLMITKTMLSVFLTRRTLFFLGRKSSDLSANLAAALFHSNLEIIQSKSSHERAYAVTNGASNLMLGVIGASILLFSDFALLLVMAIGLFTVDPVIAVSAISIFSSIGILMYLLTNKRAKSLGDKNAMLNILANRKINELIRVYRDVSIRNSKDTYINEIAEIRIKQTNATAELSLIPYLGKYVIETSLVLSGLIIGTLQFYLHDAYRAAISISIFIAAGSRIAPAVLRLQQGMVQVKSNIGSAETTLNLLDELRGIHPTKKSPEMVSPKFESSIEIHKLQFKYKNATTSTIDDVSFRVASGQTVAIVGPSGAGKSTLIDLILGNLIPTKGHVLINGKLPHETLELWPGRVAYVPQNVNVIEGTLRENVTLGYKSSDENTDLINALEDAQLLEFANSLPNRFDSSLAEFGSTLSGGQKQRLGIARALYTRPELVILDEATSSLDGETEWNVTKTLLDNRKGLTLVVVAHRLTTIMSADLIIYLDGGKILATGKFNELRALLPEFELQAQRMGL